MTTTGSASRSEDRVAAADAPADGVIRGRALLLGLLLIIPNQWWLVQMEIVRRTLSTAMAPFSGVVLILLVLTVANRIGERLLRRRQLTRAELLTIYAMLSVAAGLHSLYMLGILVPTMPHARHFARPENHWEALFFRHLPAHLVVTDAHAVSAFFEGASSFYTPAHLRAWAVPVLNWTLFTVVLTLVMLCLTAIFHRQWADRERLSYPIIQLPLAMTDAPFFRNRWMWIGFALAGGIDLVNGLNVFYPAIPLIPVRRQNIGYLFTGRPWNAISDTLISFYPFAIALGFLMPADLSLSCWVFFWVARGQKVVGEATGWGRSGGFPYLTEQAFGAYLSVFLATLWAGRGHLRRVLALAIGTRSSKTPGEAAGYRLAVAGTAAGILFLIVFADHAGMSLGMAGCLFVFYFMMAVLVARIRVEFGFPVHDVTAGGDRRMDPLLDLGGTRAFSARELTAWAHFRWINFAYLSHPMPQMAEGFRMGERTGGALPRVAWGIALAICVGTLASFWAYLDVFYRLGAATANVNALPVSVGREVYGGLAGWLEASRGTDYGAMAAASAGFLVASLLTAGRWRFEWFPFHPLAYAVAASWGMWNLWSCVLVGGALKALVMRYGGMHRYRTLLPFFLGLLLGECVVGSLWSLVGLGTRVPTYNFWP